MKHGKGRYLWNNGDSFVGEFYEDQIISGTFTQADGKTMELKV
jgi:hypothetical protein